MRNVTGYTAEWGKMTVISTRHLPAILKSGVLTGMSQATSPLAGRHSGHVKAVDYLGWILDISVLDHNIDIFYVSTLTLSGP